MIKKKETHNHHRISFIFASDADCCLYDKSSTFYVEPDFSEVTTTILLNDIDPDGFNFDVIAHSEINRWFGIFVRFSGAY